MRRSPIVIALAFAIGTSALGASPAPDAPDRHLAADAEQGAAKLKPKQALAIGRAVFLDLESRFGRPLAADTALVISNGPLRGGTIARALPARIDANNWHEVTDDPMKLCVIQISPIALFLKPKPFRGNLAHEITHCFQIDAVGVKAGHDMLAKAKWLVEGSAEWAGYAYVSAAWNKTDSWNDYVKNPEKRLFLRKYEALGFFAHVARHANAWKVMDAMWREWARTGKNEDSRNPDSFLVAQKSYGQSQAAQDRFLQSWAMGYARSRAFGADWEMAGPGLPKASVRATPKTIRITSGIDLDLQVIDPATVHLARLEAQTGLIVRVAVTGFGAIRWLQSSSETRFARKQAFQYCIVPCVCPSGQSLDPAIEEIAARTALVAMTGGVERGFLGVNVRSLTEACVPGTATIPDRDPCIYTAGEAHSIISARVGSHHPVEDILVNFFRTAPPLPAHLRPPKPAVTACLYISSFGDALWVDRLVDGSLWITYIGYPRDEVLSGTGCC